MCLECGSLNHAKLGTLKTSVTHSLLRRRAEYLNKRSKITTYLRLSEMLMRIYLKLKNTRNLGTQGKG